MAIVLIGEPFRKHDGTRNRTMVKAECLSCGEIFETRLSEVRKIKSCGCDSGYKEKHGKSRSRVYKNYYGMLSRCSNERGDKYNLYGGRGIEVCERWKNSFENFIEDMGEPQSGMSIDRIDPNGNYEKSNCRWATVVVQNNNKRTNKQMEIDGCTKTVAEWVRWHGSVNYTTVTERLARGWSDRDALFGKQNNDRLPASRPVRRNELCP